MCSLMRRLMRNLRIYPALKPWLNVGEGLDEGLRKGSGKMTNGTNNTLTEMPMVGDKLRFISDNWTFMETGGVYEVTRVVGKEFSVIVADGTEMSWVNSELDEWERIPGLIASDTSDLSALYPKYYKDVAGVESIDVYMTHELFGIDDSSGAIQHASKKLLLSGVRTGGKSKYDDIKEARDTLTRWLEINVKESQL